jgi:molecular chaperone DnaK (HSP70)
VAVGDHILLGGDNMDLALAYAVRARLDAEGTALDDWQMRALGHACRVAKERLLGADGPTEVPLAIPGRGSKLVGNTLRTTLARTDVDAVLLEGFFPLVDADARPSTPRRAGLTTIGLPYPSDAAITRHLAAFLGRSGDGFVHPTAILFNGGVTHAAPIRARIHELLAGWAAAAGASAPKLLGGTDPELAVCRGAAHYARLRKRGGVRIKGGTAQAYYIGIERAELAVPGIPPRIDAVCVAPFGMEEGSDVALPQTFGLVLGEEVAFRFFGSSTRKDDVMGAVVAPGELTELSPIETTMPAPEERLVGSIVHVRLHASITEIGTLELAAVEEQSGQRWKLSFDVRGQA